MTTAAAALAVTLLACFDCILRVASSAVVVVVVVVVVCGARCVAVGCVLVCSTLFSAFIVCCDPCDFWSLLILACVAVTVVLRRRL